MQVAVVRTGTANLASVLAGLRRAGAEPFVTTDPAVVRDAERVVLPGVGAFGAAMAALREHGLVEPLRSRAVAGRPLLGICLGLQLLTRESEESPGVEGLGVIPAAVRRFPPGPRIPQLGWNHVAPVGARVLAAGHAYFANSYRLDALPDGWGGAMGEHGGPFVAALERGRVVACQFHPELSGPWGRALLERWLNDRPAEATDEGARGGLTSRVIPCLDVRDGRIVKGVRFQGLRDAGDPVERSAAYEAQGADELVLLDVSATPEGRGHAVRTVRGVREVLGIPLTVGGGVRKVDDAAALLDAGADKVSVNTAAVFDPPLLGALAERFGRQCTVLAIDAASKPDGGWEVVVRSGTERTGIDAVQWARDGVARGAGEILLTSWDRDGTRSGYDTALLRAIGDAVEVPVIASGGAASAGHLAEALRAGASAVLAASIFHDGETTVAAVKAELAAAGIQVRR
jgi:imidazole glycerol phosphate synthase glutamine amidotransferase subunit